MTAPSPNPGNHQPIALIARRLCDRFGVCRPGSFGGILLLACTLVALVWANSPWAHLYTAVAHAVHGRMGSSI